MISIPYICEGEIVEINETPSDDTGALTSVSKILGSGSTPKSRPIVSYKCRVQLAEGQQIVCPMVIDSTVFGGIDDYLQIRRRATTDASSFSMNKPEDMMANIGDRVYIAFINGDIHRPVIIGSAQHPNQTNRFVDGVDPDTMPQLFWRYLGLSMVVDEDGQLSFSHYGAPTIKYTGTSTGLDALKGVASGLSESLGGGSGYEEYNEGSEPDDSPENKAVKPRDYRFKTTWEMLSSGMYRIRDSIGQNFVIDPENSIIEITNNGLSSTEPADGGGIGSVLGALGGGGEDAEVIRLDKAEQSVFINSRKLITIYTAGDREDTTEGDYTKEVQGDETVTIQGDQTIDIYGGVVRSVLGDVEDSVSGSLTMTVTQDVDISVDTGDVSMSIGTGSLTMDVFGAISISSKDAMTIDLIGALDITSKDEFTLDTVGGITGTSKGDISFSDMKGGGINISGGKVEVGGRATGIFQSVGDILEQLDAILTAIGVMTVSTGTGPSGPPMNITDFKQAQVKLKTIAKTLKSVTGSL